MKILVTGGAGFIGSHLVEALLAQGHSVRVLDDFSTGSRSNLPSDIELIEGDVRNASLCMQSAREIEVVYHLAALTSVPLAQQQPHEAFERNVEGTVTLLKASVDASVRRFVLASSTAVYGDTGSACPISEEVPTHPISFYAATKRACELYAHSFGRSFNFETIALRLFNVYGPRQRPLDAYAGVISVFLDRARHGRPLTIYGDGTQTRDFVHVQDVVFAFIQCLSRGSTGQAYNIGTGQKTSIHHLAEIGLALFGRTEPIEIAPARSGDILHSCADSSRARRELGFEVRMCLDAGLRQLAGV